MSDHSNNDERLATGFDPLILVVVGLVAWNAFVLWMVYTGQMDQSVGNDAAGAGMSRGFREIYAIASAIPIGLFALLFVLIRHRGMRYAMVALLAVASFLTPLLL